MIYHSITIVSHLKATNAPDIGTLGIVLEEVVKAIYGHDTVLDFQEGSVGENPYENMVHFLSSMDAGIRHHVEGILDRKFGPHFVVGYNSEMNKSELMRNFTAELDEAEKRIDERLQ